MSFGGKTFRAFRPSHFVQTEELEEEVQQGKLDNIRRYSERVEAGLPLFDKASVVENLAAG